MTCFAENACEDLSVRRLALNVLAFSANLNVVHSALELVVVQCVPQTRGQHGRAAAQFGALGARKQATSVR